MSNHNTPALSNNNEGSGRTVDFSSFQDVTQEHVIKSEATSRIIVNGGPGTGKTWTLIERILHLANSGEVEAEEILTLCYSRAAVDVVRKRLAAAAGEGRIGPEWQDISIRSFDSFCSSMLLWVQEELPELLPEGFQLNKYNYDERISHAVDVLAQDEDMLAAYRQIIVDEVQDLVNIRARLVLTLLKGLPETCGFTLLGDACQAVYDYQAKKTKTEPDPLSSDDFYRQIFQEFPSGTYFALTQNHRLDNKMIALTVPYRQAILTGTMQERSRAAQAILAEIPPVSAPLEDFSQRDADRYLQHGTLGILTRTNSQALQISARLRAGGIPHVLLRRSDPDLWKLDPAPRSAWIAEMFTAWPNETMSETDFVERHLRLFPEEDSEKAIDRWDALMNTQSGNARQRVDVEDLLLGVLRARQQEEDFYSSAGDQVAPITVSTIHRSKGREYDSVIVTENVIQERTDEASGEENMGEHKVCYVALTRSKNVIERAFFPDGPEGSDMIRLRNPDRCAAAPTPQGDNREPVSHFEVGREADIDLASLAAEHEQQRLIRECLTSGMPLALRKCPGEPGSFVTYSIVLADRDDMILGYTSEHFATALKKALRKSLGLNARSPIEASMFPDAFCHVYVGGLITCISPSISPIAAKRYGSVSVWTGFTMTGFAAVDRSCK